jgi:hypothetical protein
MNRSRRMRATLVLVLATVGLACLVRAGDTLAPRNPPTFDNMAKNPLDVGERMFLEQFLRDCAPEVRANLGDWMIGKWLKERP